MEIQFLGTGAGVPSKMRNVSSIALKLLDELNEVWMFDCGEATQQQILHTTIRPRKVKKIFITHLHGDHIFGLPGFLSSRSFQGGEDEVVVYGPKGIKLYIETSLKVSQSKLAYPIKYVEIEETGLLFENNKFEVYVEKLDHGITSYGYRIVEKDLPGELQADKLRELGVPNGPLFGKLKRGETIELENGQVINGQDYISKPVKGRVVAIFGDTRQTPTEKILAQDADVIVHESTFEAGEGRMARRYFHSTTHDAARLAKECNAKQLYLTHISSRYVGSSLKMLEAEAREIFPQTKVVKDLDNFVISLK